MKIIKTTKLPNGGKLEEWSNGDKFYLLNDHLHCEDGPAMNYVSGNNVWYLNGLIHRTNGPAIDCVNGEKHWYINGKRIYCTTQKQFEQLMRLKAFW